MMNCGDYPVGANRDSRAPYNQKDQKEEEFECLCSQTLSKSAKVFTNDYNPLYEEECGYCETTNTNWEAAWHENDHYTPLQLLELFQKLLRSQLGEDNFNKSKAYLEHLIEECDMWCEDETEYVED